MFILQLFKDELGLESQSTQYMTQAEKRAHHNALERKRRDHIKDSFHSLRDSVPTLQGEKVHIFLWDLSINLYLTCSLREPKS